MVITEQTAFPFSEFWVILNFFSLCWSSGQFSLVCSLLSLNQYFVFFIIRKIKITRDESLQSLATSEFFMASQSAVSFFLCFFSPRPSHLLWSVDDSQIDVFDPTLTLYTFLPGPVHVDSFRFCPFSVCSLTCSPFEICLGKHQSHKHLLCGS